MIAGRYGTVSIVRETGGLNDSIHFYDGQNGNGFTFHDYNAHDMLHVINIACNVFRDKNAWKDVQNRILNSDFSWNNPAGKYLELYNK